MPMKFFRRRTVTADSAEKGPVIEKPRDVVEVFVDNSEAISGIRPFDLEREGTKRHLDIGKIIASSKQTD